MTNNKTHYEFENIYFALSDNKEVVIFSVNGVLSIIFKSKY